MIFELWRDSNSRAIIILLEVTHFTASDLTSVNTKTGLNKIIATVQLKMLYSILLTTWIHNTNINDPYGS